MGRKKVKKDSDIIKEFLDYINSACKQYSFNNQQMTVQNKLSDDLLHKLEIKAKTASERNSISKELQICRKDRRYYKDKVEMYRPVYEFASDNHNKKVINQLTQMLGEIRKTEEYHANRKYRPKVLDNF